MCLFVETVRIEGGVPCNLARHNARLNSTLTRFWPGSSPVDLEAVLAGLTHRERHKARVVYGERGVEELTCTPYHPRAIRTLRLVEDDAIDYSFKSVGREPLNRLAALADGADDIIIVKNGLLTDTSFTNIALTDGHRWFTPAMPLLRGTKRAELLDSGLVVERDIPTTDCCRYKAVRLFNAMLDFGEIEVPMNMVMR